MPYVSGTAADITALMDNIRTACTDNGWTLSGSVLHKGACYVKSAVVSGLIEWTGGTGKDGSNNLTGAAPRAARTGSFLSNAIAYPVNYEVFIFSDPDEVVAVVNYSTDFYQYVMFGLSDVANLPGAGVYFAASRFWNAGVTSASEFISAPGGSSLSSAYQGGPPFQTVSVANNVQNSFIYHGFDGGGWSTDSTTGTGYPTSFQAVAPLLSLLPSAWNSETVLLPFPIYLNRTTGNKVSLVADLKNIRHCRIDNHAPGDIVTLGTDEWKLYPWYKKDAANRNGGSGVMHSGTLAFAVRYDGGS